MKCIQCSLTGKLLLFTSISLSIVLFVMTYFSVNSAIDGQKSLAHQYNATIKSLIEKQEQSTLNLINKKGTALVDFMAQSAGNLMLNFDYETIQAIADNGKKDANLAFVAFFDTDGTLVAGSTISSVKNSIQKDIIVADEKMGHILVGLDYTDLQESMAQLSKQNDSLLQKIKAIMGASRKKMILTLSIAAVTGIILLCLLLYGAFRKIIINPIKTTLSRLKDIAEGEGDLTKRLAVTSQDELGSLADYFNMFVNKLQSIIKELSYHAASLDNSAGTLGAISNELSEGAGKMSQRTMGVVDATNRMNTFIASVADTVEEVSEKTNSMAESSQIMSSNINKITANVQNARERSGNAVEQSNQSSTKMHEMGQAAEEIGSVIDIITDISSQTNLLSLNATIEAARAGEAGKGFAVVANEIKELAKQTAEATHNISDRLVAIQSSSDDTISSIEGISEAIVHVNDSVASINNAMEQQNRTTAEISDNISHTAKGLEEVVNNVNQASQESSGVARDIHDVDVIADGVNTSSKQLNQTSSELSSLADKIKMELATFRV